jgi:hypothetical protein
MTDPDNEPPLSEMTQCAMCRAMVPIRQTMNLGGRVLCFGCASGWFDDDEDSDAE